MAERKPLFMDQVEGYQTEMNVADTATFGGLTLSGALAMGGNRITGIPDLPTAPTDAVNQNYVDSVAQGLVIKDPVNCVAVSNVASLSGVGTVIDGHTVVDNDRILLTGQTDVPFSGTGDSLAGPFSGTGDSLTFATGVVTLVDSAAAFVAEDVGKRITISGATNPGNNGTFTITGRSDANTITFNNASGVTETSSFAYLSNDVALTDSAANFVAGDVGKSLIISGASNSGNNGTFTIYSRMSATTVIFANASGVTETSSFAWTGPTGISNGIWVAHTAAPWTRPTDFLAGTHASGSFVFVETGTSYADTGWVCTTDRPTDIVGTDPNAWVQFSSAGVITAGSGLQKVGNVISVKKGDGIEVTSNSAATNVALSSTDPGLALVGTSPNKTLEALVDGATGAIQKTAAGIALKLNGTTLQIGASGVSVKGLPSSFEINGIATNYATPGTGQVTAANLNTLTAGSGSNADALHVHAVGAATEAPKIENSLAVGAAVTAGYPVYFTSVNNRIEEADTVDPKARVAGVARTGQATPGNTCEVVSSGPCTGILSGATAGDAYYLATGGGLSTSLPGSSKRVVRVGYAMNATDLFVIIADFGKKA